MNTRYGRGDKVTPLRSVIPTLFAFRRDRRPRRSVFLPIFGRGMRTWSLRDQVSLALPGHKKKDGLKTVFLFMVGLFIENLIAC